MASIKINEQWYELPESFTLKELRIVEKYCGGHMGDGYEFAKTCGAIHIAIMRQKPDVPFDEIEQVVNDLDITALEMLAGQSPPTGTEKPNEPAGSPNGSSEPGSDAAQENENQDSSGSPLSDTGFRSFHQTSTT